MRKNIIQQENMNNTASTISRITSRGQVTVHVNSAAAKKTKKRAWFLRCTNSR